MTNRRESYEQFCASVGVQPMPEAEWNAFSDNLRYSEVSGFCKAAGAALNDSNLRKPHNDRQYNPKPTPQPQLVLCRPTRTFRQRDWHARNRHRLDDLHYLAQLQLRKPRRQQARAIHWDASGQRIAA
jgi:hypothetical protein